MLDRVLADRLEAYPTFLIYGVIMFSNRKTSDVSWTSLFLGANPTRGLAKIQRFKRERQLRKRSFLRRLFIEALEPRQLMAANIVGTVYEDVDRIGTRNNGENGISGWTAYLDVNRDGAKNMGEPSAITDSNGDYRFNAVAAGNYRVAVIVQAGWVATAPVYQASIQPRMILRILTQPLRHQVR